MKELSVLKIKAFKALKFNRIFSYPIKLDNSLPFPASLTKDNIIFLNPDQVKLATNETDIAKALLSNKTVFILLHEIMHDVLDHLPRRTMFLGENAPEQDLILWNFAADVVVNENLIAWTPLEYPPQTVTKDSLELPHDIPLITEVIYRYLKHNTNCEILESQNVGNDYRVITTTITTKNGKVLYKEAKVFIQKSLDENANLSYKSVELLESLKQAGITGGDIENEIEFIKSPVNLRQHLFKYFEVLKSGSDDITFLRPAKLDYIMNGNDQVLKYPTFISRTVKTVIGIDTSGSISDDEYGVFISTVWNHRQVLEGKVVFCDADIKSTVDLNDSLSNLKDELRKRKGYGGTSYEPVFEMAENEHVDLVIYFTDLFPYSFPERPKFKVIWVVKLDNSTYQVAKELPYGKVIWF